MTAVTLGGATLGTTNQLVDSALTSNATSDTQTLGISLPNTSGTLQITCSGTGTCTASPSTISGSSGNVQLTYQPGTYSLQIIQVNNSTTAFSASLAIYGSLTVSPASLSFQAVSPNTGSTAGLSIFQPGPSASNLTVAWSCATGAVIGMSGTFTLASANSATINEPFGTTYAETVTAYSAPNSGLNPTHACTITVTGGGSQTGTTNVDIFPTSINISGARRGVAGPGVPLRRPQ